MVPTAQLCLVLHNHQPIGNFDGVFEQAYQDSYLPFLDVFEPFAELRISLHTSGPLMLWLAERHPEYLERLRRLAAQQRIEIIGGPLYEPILSMLPSRDRIGQIRAYSQWIEEHLDVKVAGMWTPERVWESHFASDLADAGIGYTVLDDFHFHAAGLPKEQLTGYFITEEEGRLLRVFPGSEQLRYLIPFAPVEQTIDYIRGAAEQQPGSVFVFGDDGEKFGTWPDTQQHVYGDGWLIRFFEALTDNRDWLATNTLAQAIESTPAKGKVYLPDCSYREMTEWALPVAQQIQYDDATRALRQDSAQWDSIQPFVRGGFWRNFKVKYPEANEMYARMLSVSRRLADMQGEIDPDVWKKAQDHLYRGQCNCSYWHGAFGGIYLPHLRNAVYHELITADNLLNQQRYGATPWVEATVEDYDFDGDQEVRLSSDKMVAWLAPARGGRLYELDTRSIAHNLLATMQRKPEPYHRKVLSGASGEGDSVASIHDRVVFKQAGLDQMLQYDRYPRKSLMDHFWDDDATLDAVRSGDAIERGDFVDLGYEAKLRRAADRIQVQMRRDGNAWGIPLSITKAVTMSVGSETLEIAYLIEDLPKDRPLHFAIELNFAGLPAGADDRYFSDLEGERLGQLGKRLDLNASAGIQMTDEWLGIDVALSIDRPSGVWAFPVQTVSQSEAGFELVHQSVCVMPHWIVTGDADGRWTVTMRLAIRDRDTPLNRKHADAADLLRV
ncbi:Alpha-amylase 1 [Rosistilla carotiformis]|uniref:Alpha-amylase 1 n=1 Tax=Rosistilla carotiformis TaxID=2528017 RepID=A0A518JV88_9BACT|nr:alpha-amylase/4-alpha-glucanotransferase domain-containing protein [Rosistilla carotiformis]QDV69460.1 Alpha-amylase 1 [Rosistilla carotiformis]